MICSNQMPSQVEQIIDSGIHPETSKQHDVRDAVPTKNSIHDSISTLGTVPDQQMRGLVQFGYNAAS
jgi:hypothetical protein